MNKVINIIFITIFLIIICVPMAGSIFVETLEVSKSEKRKLAQFPELDGHSRTLKAFPQAFNAYVNDHFLFRDKLVELNSRLRVKLLKTSPTMAVAIGKDNWLFAMMDWVLHDFLGARPLNDQQLETWKNALLQRQKLLSSWGGHYLHVIVPNKISIYPENAPERLITRKGQTMLEQLSEYLKAEPELGDSYLDLTEVLREGKSETQVYFKTDTHWTTRGAFIGYQRIIEKLNQAGLPINSIDDTQLTQTILPAVSGDLAKFMGASDYLKEQSLYYTLEKPCASAKSSKIKHPMPSKTYFLKKNGCDHGAPLSVILISDSFGNSLIGYLNETFQESVLDGYIKFLDLIPYLKEHKPDLVIRVSVARFMPKSFLFDPDLETNF